MYNGFIFKQKNSNTLYILQFIQHLTRDIFNIELLESNLTFIEKNISNVAQMTYDLFLASSTPRNKSNPSLIPHRIIEPPQTHERQEQPRSSGYGNPANGRSSIKRGNFCRRC